MATALQLPVTKSPAAKVGRTLFKKQILPVGQIDVKGRTLNFTRDVLAELKATFEDRAMDQVPFVLADESNRHTDDPERFRGEVQALEAADDGLYATVETTERGAALLADNPNLPVSVRAFPPELGRAGGRWVLGHVCGTLDPVAKGMGGWAAIEASADTEVLDLSGEAFVLSASGSSSENVAEHGSSTVAKEGDPKPSILERLKTFLAAEESGAPAETGGAETTGTAPAAEETTETKAAAETKDGESEVKQSEVEEVIAQLLAAGEAEGETETAPEEREPVAASNTDTGAVELAEQVKSLKADVDNAKAETAAERAKAEAKAYIDNGVPPSMVNLATPILERPQVALIELSNGKKADPQDVIRGLLKAAEGTVELAERGSAEGGTEAGQKDRQERAEQAVKDFA